MKRIMYIFVLVFIYSCVFATTYTATNASQLQSYSNSLVAGDTLIAQSGTYSFNWNIQDLTGSADDYIVIMASSGAIINGTAYDNVIDVYNCHYVKLIGFDITDSNGGYGIDGIKFRSSCSHFEMIDLVIHDITGVGVSANPSGLLFDNLIFRHCHIYNVSGVGEGLYIGTHDGSTEVRNSIVENCYIHDCHPAKGIQFKQGSHGCIIRDNVVHDCDEAGIVLYKSNTPGIENNNIVERNAVFNCGEGVFAVGQTNIHNNVVFACNYGINIRNYDGWGIEDLFIINNTVYDCEIRAVYLNDWNISTGTMIFANNAVYQNTTSESAIYAPDGLGVGVCSGNMHYGTCDITGSSLGNAPSVDFEYPSTEPGFVNLYPSTGSSLIDNADNSYIPSDDFNGTIRASFSTDIGAYEHTAPSNPGWQIDESFKDLEWSLAETVYNKSELSNNIQVYPQPSKSFVMFEFEHQIPEHIEIYDIHGKRVFNSEIYSNLICWNIPDEAKSGVYLVKATTPAEILISKIIVY